MTQRYQHTQIGYINIIAFSCGILALLSFMIGYGFDWIFLMIQVILGICLLFFGTLTVVVENGILEIRFGIGIIRKKFYLRDIQSCTTVENPWYFGWGIRWTPHGWLYNVSGFSAVELTPKTGKKFRVGTDDADNLEKAISKFL